jgi:PAS domain S-box-containing protein
MTTVNRSIDFISDDTQFPALCVDEGGCIQHANRRACELIGYPHDEIEHLSVGDLFFADLLNDPVTVTDLGNNRGGRGKILHKNGHLLPVEYQITHNGQPGHYFIVLIDLSEYEQTEEKLTVQLKRMQALSNIDRAIMSTMDIAVIAEVVFDKLSSHLNMDFCMLFLYDATSQHLICEHSRGLSALSVGGKQALAPAPMMANEIAAFGEMIIYEDFPAGDQIDIKKLSFPYRHSKFYAGIPLFNLRETIGILEVCSRRPFFPDQEWKNFFNLVAGQISIAIVHTNQFHSIQRLNHEILQAYENTLEGWARALEYKDRETKGHSDRVKDMTVKLGKSMGLAGADLIHLRRGAILHDLGKMCIPERILFKPSPLDDAEWQIMKQHPVYAQEFLADIQYLQPATIIPLYHHERWDGSGYPFGLKGKQIPLAARIFMVVDVWDALSFARPYRQAWSDEQVRKYLHDNAGILFDPDIVSAFLDILPEAIPG